MEIEIKTTQELIKIKLKENEINIPDIKHKINEILIIPPQFQTLIYGNNILDDLFNLSQLFINKNSMSLTIDLLIDEKYQSYQSVRSKN